ncbi:MAG: ATP-binding protein [Gammaproteobacteria bacterium]|nr:MAG: ATP-binding protein [Gammaproteobacteria bacterium]
MDEVGEDVLSERQRDEIIVPLRAGVVPRVGLEHFQVGRGEEMRSLSHDITKVAQGGVSFRIVSGAVGSGKTFIGQSISSQARLQGLVVSTVDLNPRLRLAGGKGQSRDLYREMVRNLSTRTRSGGLALSNIVERFVFSAIRLAHERACSPTEVIEEQLRDFEELTGGFDFIEVIRSYWQGLESANETLKQDALAWLQAKFSRLSDAKKCLNVRSVVDDKNYFDVIKMLAHFIRLAGYKGLLLNIDETALITQLPAPARNKEYEQLLFILNDLMQGSCEGLAIILYATPSLMNDPKRGVPSHSALYSRLSPNPFVESGWQDFSGPVLALAALSGDEIVQLLFKLRDVFSYGDVKRHVLDDEGVYEFIETYLLAQFGEGQNTRGAIRLFLDYLAVREFNRNRPVTVPIHHQRVIAEIF